MAAFVTMGCERDVMEDEGVSAEGLGCRDEWAQWDNGGMEVVTPY